MKIFIMKTEIIIVHAMKSFFMVFHGVQPMTFWGIDHEKCYEKPMKMGVSINFSCPAYWLLG